MSVRIGLAGGRGYVGEELLGLMFKNPDFEVVYGGSRGLAGRPVVSEYRDLPTDLVFKIFHPHPSVPALQMFGSWLRRTDKQKDWQK